MLKEPHYFGCVGESGHYPFNAQYRSPSIEIYNALQSYDGGQKGNSILPNGFKNSSEQVEGQAGLTYQADLDATVLAFWDRSIDHRGGSWSGFFLPGKISDPAAAIEAAKTAFPKIWQRFTFEIKVAFVTGF